MAAELFKNSANQSSWLLYNLSYHILCLIVLQYAIWIPALTLILKFPLLLPPVDWYLTKIRGGWTRGIEKYSHSAQIIGA